MLPRWAQGAGSSGTANVEALVVDSVRYGALDIAVTDRFVRVWDDNGSGATLNGSFFNPYISDSMYQQGWRVLGGVGHGGREEINGRYGTVLVRGVSATDPETAPPVRFELIWNDAGSGAKKDGSVWRMIPPAGYVALGDVFQLGHGAPDPRWFACVRRNIGGRSYVREGHIGELIWNDKKSGAKKNVSVWQVRAPQYPSDPTERLILGADLYRAVGHHDKPSDTVYVLDLPAAVVKRQPPNPPRLESHAIPPQETGPITDRVVTVPFTTITDPGKTLAWQAANSPFYTLERRVNYRLVLHRDNSAGSETPPDSQAVTTGVTTENSQEYSRRTSVTVSASAGISFKGLSAGVETSATTELGYSTRYSVAQLVSETKTWSLLTPPRKSGALWAARHEIITLRKDGTDVGGRGGLKFDVDSRVTGEYPPAREAESAVRVLVDGIEVADDPKDQPFGEAESNVPETPQTALGS
ncbi:Vps62-related protein [Streptomyces olivoreticuli]|uniref:Vps62-related protein n=1 Tax=Streptomyces olivoreticuli TaxID=68246 RepID=UPI002657F9D0|nr:Vps62-related protein [Streptomyces olivoreticuli]WKK27178.1 Vps62-related protein [Streptomyces olivoreticuli]